MTQNEYLLSEIPMFIPLRSSHITLSYHTYKELTQAEKRFHLIIERMKRTKCFLNRAIRISILIPCGIIMLGITGMICWLIRCPNFGILFGLLIGISLLCIDQRLSDYFETDIFYVKIKHKGKIYGWL